MIAARVLDKSTVSLHDERRVRERCTDCTKCKRGWNDFRSRVVSIRHRSLLVASQRGEQRVQDLYKPTITHILHLHTIVLLLFPNAVL